jgi:hypothetical protein
LCRGTWTDSSFARSLRRAGDLVPIGEAYPLREKTNSPSDASPDEYQRRHRGATLGDSGAATTQLLNAGSRMPGPNRHTSTVRGTLCDRRMTPAAGRLLPGVSSPWRKKGCI